MFLSCVFIFSLQIFSFHISRLLTCQLFLSQTPYKGSFLLRRFHFHAPPQNFYIPYVTPTIFFSSFPYLSCLFRRTFYFFLPHFLPGSTICFLFSLDSPIFLRVSIKCFYIPSNTVGFLAVVFHPCPFSYLPLILFSDSITSFFNLTHSYLWPELLLPLRNISLVSIVFHSFRRFRGVF